MVLKRVDQMLVLSFAVVVAAGYVAADAVAAGVVLGVAAEIAIDLHLWLSERIDFFEFKHFSIKLHSQNLPAYL